MMAASRPVNLAAPRPARSVGTAAGPRIRPGERMRLLWEMLSSWAWNG